MVTFIEILNRLSADEIKILEYMNSPINQVPLPELTEDDVTKYGLTLDTKIVNITGSLPIIDLKREISGQTGYLIVKKNFNYLEEKIKLDATNNIDFYIDNMISLGLIKKEPNFMFANDKIYHCLENHVKIINIKKEFELIPNFKINFVKGRIDMTDLGNKLLSLCSHKN